VCSVAPFVEYFTEEATDPSSGAVWAACRVEQLQGLLAGWRAGNRNMPGCVRSTQPGDTPATQARHIRSSVHAVFRAPAIPRTVLRGVAGAQPGDSAQKYTYIKTDFDSAQAERVPASAGGHVEAARSDEEARPERSRKGRREVTMGSRSEHFNGLY
jgi:hypothetical protein